MSVDFIIIYYTVYYRVNGVSIEWYDCTGLQSQTVNTVSVCNYKIHRRSSKCVGTRFLILEKCARPVIDLNRKSGSDRRFNRNSVLVRWTFR